MEKRSFLFAILACLLLAFLEARAETFSSWRSSHFTPAQLSDSSISGPLANPDADSFSNLAEYAFALEPFTINGNEEALVFSPADPLSDGFLFTYTERKDATDLFYQIEYSGDLNNPMWNLLTDPQEPNAAVDLGSVWQRTIAVPQHFSAREFLRLRLFQYPTSGQPPILNDPPQNLIATLHEPFLDIDLTWIDRSNQETGYRIERRPDGASTWTNITTTPGDTVSYRDRHLASNTLFEYRVTAILKTGSLGQPSSEATLQTPVDSDGDNLPDTFETQIGTDPNDPDSDNDGLSDDYEIQHGTKAMATLTWEPETWETVLMDLGLPHLTPIPTAMAFRMAMKIGMTTASLTPRKPLWEPSLGTPIAMGTRCRTGWMAGLSILISTHHACQKRDTPSSTCALWDLATQPPSTIPCRF